MEAIVAFNQAMTLAIACYQKVIIRHIDTYQNLDLN